MSAEDDRFRPKSRNSHAGPARGVLAGVRADVHKANEAGSTYNPVGVGAAWTHNFLNQKPWHPLNFKNQTRVYEAEQKVQADKKLRERGQAEFEAEQDYLKTLSYLSEAEQQRYKEIQSVSFMYTKPPGLDSALARDAAEAKKAASAAGAPLTAPTAAAAPAAATGSAGMSSAAGEQAGPGAHALPGKQPDATAHTSLERIKHHDPYTAMLAARLALERHERLSLKAVTEVHGGYDDSATNQQYLVEDDPPPAPGSGVAALLALPHDQQLAALKALAREQRKQERKDKVAQATAVLQAAGYDVEALTTAATGKLRQTREEVAAEDEGMDKSKSKDKDKRKGKGKDKEKEKSKTKSKDKSKRKDKHQDKDLRASEERRHLRDSTCMECAQGESDYDQRHKRKRDTC